MLISETWLYTLSRCKTWIFVMCKYCFTGQNDFNLAHIDILLYYVFEKQIHIFDNF